MMNNSPLLYRFDEKNNCVIFLSKIANKNYGDCKSKSQKTTLNFNEVLNYQAEVQSDYKKYAKCMKKIESTIDGSKLAFWASLSLLKTISSNSCNYFESYYSNTLCNKALSERTNIDVASYVPSTSYFNSKVEESKSSIENELTNIKKALFYGSNSFKNITKGMIVNKKTIHYIKDGNNESYTVADNALLNFFVDFNSIVNNKKLVICRCKRCNKLFFNKQHKDYCKSEACIKKSPKIRGPYKKDDKKTYKEIYNAIRSYIRNQRSELNTEYQDKELIKEYNTTVKKDIIDPLCEKYEMYRTIEDNLASEDFIEFKQKLYKDFSKIITSIVLP